MCQRVALLASANRGVVSERELLLDVGRRANREFSDRPDARASLASAMGRACADHGDLVHAEELLTGAIAQQSATIGDDARGTLRSRSALARVLFRSGRIEESRRSMGPLLAACKRRLADTDPVALEVLVLQVRLELDAPTTPRESERLAWTALSFVRSASDVPARTVARAYGNLARALALSGRFEEADRAAERAISEATCALGPMHPVTLEMSVCRGTLLNVAGRPADADDVLGAALDQQEHRLGKTHPSRLPALRELLRAQALSGRGEDAKVTARELLAVVHAQPQLDAMIAKHASAEAEAILTPSSRARDAGG